MADPDLQVEVGGSHPDPEIRGASLKKNYFQPFRHQFGLKIIVGPGPSPGSATESLVVERREREKKITISARTPPPAPFWGIKMTTAYFLVIGSLILIPPRHSSYCNLVFFLYYFGACSLHDRHFL